MIKEIKNICSENKLILGLFLWIGSNIILHDYNSQRNIKTYFSNPIIYQNQKDFSKDLELEKQKLGLENINIFCENDSNTLGGHCFKKGPKEYLIKFNPKYKSKEVLKHELYHIYKWENFSLDDLLDGVLFGNYEEYRATNYSLKDK